MGLDNAVYLDKSLKHLLQWGRNFIVAEMGCGGQRTKEDVLLQWGRNFIVAEMTPILSLATIVSPLQWGRNFIVAEILISFVIIIVWM